MSVGLMVWAIVGAVNAEGVTRGVATVDSAQAEPSLDVEAQIWPIFRTRCLSCHGPETPEGVKPGGGFRVDTIDGIKIGGHTGNTILGDDGELLRRLVSTDDSYRMPKGENPLSKSQIDRIREWINAGAPWPEGGVIAFPKLSEPTSHLGSNVRKRPLWETTLDTLSYAHEKIRWLLFPLVIYLIAVLLLERRRKSLQLESALASAASVDRSRFDRLALACTSAHYLSAYLLIILVGLVGYHVQRVADIERELVAARVQSRSISAGLSRVVQPRSQVEPYRPLHPRRLGGTYYRGNDERNRNLFNGGYYRTATFRLSLRDHDNRVIQWGDKINPNSVFVHLEIERAPFTTTELFNERIFEGCYLSDSVSNGSSSRESTTPAYFRATDSPDRWEATIKLAVQADLNELSGLIHLYNQGSVHFGIRYDVHFENESVVSKTSDLWMGAILLPSGAIVPQESEIPIAQWFDFLPIPEIAQPNTDDPMLLGIPEHK